MKNNFFFGSQFKETEIIVDDSFLKLHLQSGSREQSFFQITFSYLHNQNPSPRCGAQHSGHVFALQLA